MCKVAPSMVSVATKRGISVIHQSTALLISTSVYIYTTPVVEIRSTHFVAMLTIYGVTSHSLQNPSLNSKQVSNNKRLNQPTIIT